MMVRCTVLSCFDLSTSGASMSDIISSTARPGIWRIAGQLSRRQYWMFAALGLFIPFAGWALFSASGWVDPIFLPGPLKVFTRLVSWLFEDDLMGDAAISIYRVAAGFALSAVLALPLGLLIGSFRPVEALLEPLTDFIRYMPAVAFIPLVMLWLGIGESAKISIIFIGTFFQMVLMVAENVRLVPMAQIEAALTMGATRFEMIRLVLAQSARPAILDTLRITMGWAWTYLVVAELVAANSGLGYAILKAQRYLKTDTIFGGIILIGVIGLLMDQGFRWLHRRLYPWAQTRG
jgi:NitT/TauT family transport system permease protein